MKRFYLFVVVKSFFYLHSYAAAPHPFISIEYIYLYIRDTLISDGDFVGNLMASYGSYGSGDGEQEDSSVWMFPPPEGLSATTNFKDTKELCKSQERWLLINIQDPQIIASHNLNGDVWCDEVVQSIIQTFFVFWQVGRMWLFTENMNR